MAGELKAAREIVATALPILRELWDVALARVLPTWQALEPLLVPAEIPERERLVHDDPELAAQIRDGIAQAERGETVDRGSFVQHLDDAYGESDEQ